MKIVREHYLRDDIGCGAPGCAACGGAHEGPALEPQPQDPASSLCPQPHYLLPDTNVLLHQIVSAWRPGTWASVASSLRLPGSLETYVEQEQGENANDRNDRAIRVAAKWYNEHLKKMSADNHLQVIFITNDRKNKEKAIEEGIPAFTCEEYVKSLTANPELIDRLACLSEEVIILQGLKHLNRAVHEDIVAVELLPKSQWVAPSSVVLLDEGQNEDVEKEEERERMLKTAVSEKMLKPTGRVVGIIKRNWRPYCGMLSKSDIKESRRHLFTPADKRIPRIRIETRQASTLEGRRIIVAIDGWPRNSRYPNGHFVRNLGDVGEKETETEVLLLEHDVPHKPFSQAVLSFLPKMPWSITEKDMKNREDLRHLCICSVDPPGCTDIDDALHCRELENGNLEVGVHIADVSHFIRPGNALDQESARRGTTVYLCEKRIDMVPELLSSNLCSLKCDVDRALTLSSPEVRFHMDSETHDPIDLQAKELRETNSMVEEFMLLANISVAKKIHEEFSEHALLRKHPAPPPSNYEILVKAARSRNLEIKTDTAKSLAESLDRAESPTFPYLNTLLRILATRCMMQAVYFCSGMDNDFHHYGLASPIYTHFTSPIRRYADVIVHRLLAVAVGADCTYPELTDKHKLADICKNLNFRHKMAQYAQRASVAFHTQLFFKSRGIVSEEAYILFVRKNAIVVLIPKYGLEGTVFFEEKDKPNPRLIYDDEIPSLKIEDTVFHVFDKVKVKIMLDSSNLQHQKIRMSLVEPQIPGISIPTDTSNTDLNGPEKKKIKLGK
ncbi:hypothetical protein H8958_002243 [Nasalis larvatus]